MSESTVAEPKQKTLCFWCEVELTDATRTRDHILSRPFRKPKITNKIEPCCSNCNGKRSLITSLCVQVRDKGKNRSEKLINSISTRMDLLNLFRQRVSEKLTGQYLQRCLKEIDEVLAYHSKQTSEPVPVIKGKKPRPKVRQAFNYVKGRPLPWWRKWPALVFLKLAYYLTKEK